MKYLIISIGILFLIHLPNLTQAQKPCVAFSFDDGNPNDILNYKGAVWNQMIRDQLSQHDIKAVWFVVQKILENEPGRKLLQQWDSAGHLIANHTYSHPNFNDSTVSCKGFIREIERCDSAIKGYQHYRRIFRYPYLKAGNSVTKRDSIFSWLKLNDYKQGWVTIDASDWYINMRLIKRLKENPKASIDPYRDYYLNHIMERAKYYNQLSKEINHREIKHTLLLHFNLTSALFLNDLIERFKQEGWEIANYSDAITDPIYEKTPLGLPAEQSLTWMQALEAGSYKNQLRYPGEDGDYEKEKMDKLGL